MTEKNLVLYVASYDDEAAAQSDFETLKELQDDGDVKVLAAEVASRDESGKVRVREHERGEALTDIGLGAAAGALVGLFAPVLLAATAIGAAVGGVLHEIHKRYDEHEIAKDVDEYLPANSSAILAVVDDEYADRLDKALDHATKKLTRAVDSGDFRKLERAMESADKDINRAVDS